MKFRYRNYQKKGESLILEAFLDYIRVMFQLPTGGGKSVIIAGIINKFAGNGKKVLFVVDRKELVEQIKNTLFACGVPCGVIMAGYKPIHGIPVQVASIQTINRRHKPQADIIVVDEAHATKSNTYQKLFELYPDARILGFTATPYRLSGDGFKDTFDYLIEAKSFDASVKQLINQGYLVPIKHYVCSVPDFDELKVVKGEYTDESAKKAMQTAPFVESYLKYSDGGQKKAIVFATDVEHSQNIAAQYRDSGIQAEHIDSDTPKTERERIVADFKKGRIKVLCNCMLFTTGFDVPDIEIVQLARMTKSLSLYLQMVGRGTRPLAGLIDNLTSDDERVEAIQNSSKPHLILLDHAGLFYEHGLSEMDRDWQYYFSRTKSLKPPKKEKDELFVGVDESGSLRMSARPEELSELVLQEVTAEHLDLLEFERHLQNAISKGYKIVSAYYKFLDYLRENQKQITKLQFDYLANRIKNSNKEVSEEKRVKPYFFVGQKKELFDLVKV